MCEVFKFVVTCLNSSELLAINKNVTVFSIILLRRVSKCTQRELQHRLHWVQKPFLSDKNLLAVYVIT